jgi:pimeloyl-ACP methyl ester carboxylesterase
LFDTTARPDTPESRQRRMDMADIARRGGFSRIPSQMLANQVAPGHTADERITAAVFGMAQRVGPGAFIRQQTAIMNRVDSRPDLPAISCPTLVVVGRQDSITTPEIMGEIADGIAGARLVIVEDSGHLTPLEQPHAASALLRYWLQI